MKIRLYKEEFLRQLNLNELEDLPDIIYFDGIPVHTPDIEKTTLEVDYPKLVQKLSPTEYSIVNELYKHIGKQVDKKIFYKFIKPGKNLVSNTVAVHFANIRRKINKTNVPLQIEPIREGIYRGGIVLTKK